MYGIIDIGSNTIRLSVYATKPKLHPVFHQKNTAGLISYIGKDRLLSQEGIHKLVYVLGGFRHTLDILHIKHVFVFATAPLRRIENTEEVLSAVWERTGFSVRVLTGEEEAQFAFCGAMQALPYKDGLLLDIGGGSTELVFYKDREVLYSTSLPMGSLSLYQTFVSQLLPTKEERRKIKNAIGNALSKTLLPVSDHGPLSLCAVGGTARAACKLINRKLGMPSQNRHFSTKILQSLLHQFHGSEKKVFAPILQVAPDRIHTLVPGMILLKTIAKHYNASEITVSETGVREGYLTAVLADIGVLNEEEVRLWRK